MRARVAEMRARVAAMHPRAPWRDITFGGVYWNCEARLERLLRSMRPWFERIVVCVQESPDGTAAVAERYADLVIRDRHWGHCEPSMATLLAKVETPWVFIVSDDEMPSEGLLHSFQDLADTLIARRANGAWFHFRSTIDGFDFTSEQHEHLRLFEPSLGWPKTLHSRPMIGTTIPWRPSPEAYISHDRSLDEMVRDYLRYEAIAERDGAGASLRAHNQMMIRDACLAIAERRSPAYVAGHPWWPEAVRVAFGGHDPFARTQETKGA